MPDEGVFGSVSRRATLAAVAALVAVPTGALEALSRQEPDVTDIVLVHGAWHGAWCWDLVRPLLEGEGLRVHAITLPGLAERADELSAEIGLQDHIDDAVRQIAALDLNQFTLVGHSYGGMVITGVADALRSQIAHIVYLDAALPKDGETMLSYGAPRPAEAIAGAEAAMRGLAPDGIGMDPFPPSVLGIPEDHERYDWVAKNLTAHPLKTWLDPIALANGGADGLPGTYILCTDPMLAQTQFAWVADQKRDAPGWDVVELATGHDAMITEPHRLASILVKASSAKKESR